MTLVLVSHSFPVEADSQSDPRGDDKGTHREPKIGKDADEENHRDRERDNCNSPNENELSKNIENDNALGVNTPVEFQTIPSQFTFVFPNLGSPVVNPEPNGNDIQEFHLLLSPNTFQERDEVVIHLDELQANEKGSQNGRNTSSISISTQRKKKTGRYRSRRNGKMTNDKEHEPKSTLRNTMSPSDNTLYTVEHGVTKTRPYKCDQCGDAFTISANRSRHIQTAHPKTGIYHKCSKCPATFRTSKAVKRHEKQVHNPNSGEVEITSFTCKACGRIFSSIYGLAIHVGNHNCIGPFRCIVCSHTFTMSGNAARHLRRAHGEKSTIHGLKLLQSGNGNSQNSKPERKGRKESPRPRRSQNIVDREIRPCKLTLTRCDSLIKSESKVVVKDSFKDPPVAGATEATEIEIEDTFTCRNAGDGSQTQNLDDFKSSRLDEQGTVSVHANVEDQNGSVQSQASSRIYKCPYCFEPFLEASNLIAHLPIHSTQTDTSQKYNRITRKCKRQARKNQLHQRLDFSSSHPRTLGGVAKPFICRYCPYSSKTKQRLVIHMRHHRKRKKHFRCPLCISYYPTFKAMRNHMGLLHKK